jgi:hypothetical protein
MESVDHTAATERLSEDRGDWSEVRDDSIHRSAWNRNSQKLNVRFKEFYEVRPQE